jgi:hypothetical protein
MKFQILFLFCLSLACSCQISQKAETDEFSNETNFNQKTTVNSSENKQTEIVKSKPVDVSRFSSVKIERTDRKSKFSLEINVEYPQIKNPKTQQESKFNRLVKKRVDEQILDFNNYLEERHKERKGKGAYEINLSYDIEYFSEDFVSVLMKWNGYSGYLNMDHFPSTINYDLKKGTESELKNIFEPDSKYLEKLSETAIAKLKRTCLYCGCGENIHAGDPLPEGEVNDGDKGGMFDLDKAVSAKEENFSNWSITAKGLKITFNEYQVGPGCIGIIDIVIPFSDLQPILRKDLNFN